MTKKHFIALADTLRDYETETGEQLPDRLLSAIGHFCYRQNSFFMFDRWHSYIRGLCGPSGGTIKRKAA